MLEENRNKIKSDCEVTHFKQPSPILKSFKIHTNNALQLSLKNAGYSLFIFEASRFEICLSGLHPTCCKRLQKFSDLIETTPERMAFIQACRGERTYELRNKFWHYTSFISLSWKVNR